jgi:hypothetical protein
VAKVGTSKAGGTISQLGCGTSVACHGRPLKKNNNNNNNVCIYICGISCLIVFVMVAYNSQSVQTCSGIK